MQSLKRKLNSSENYIDSTLLLKCKKSINFKAIRKLINNLFKNKNHGRKRRNRPVKKIS